MNYTFDRLRLQIFISLAPAPLHRKIGKKFVTKTCFCLHIFTPAPAQKAPAPTGSAKLPMSIILKKDILTGMVVLLLLVTVIPGGSNASLSQ